MNVLILTPDRVGSTLLQRLLTIYMLRREFDKPVINLHELTNGLVSYFNPTLNCNTLGKPDGVNKKWGYFQSLPEIVNLLKSVDHYKTSRLAHYHLVNRSDVIRDQLEFYEYLNENFFIISCRRENLFEHALSWVIQSHSKKLNVYSAVEKISTFNDIYQQGITVSKDSLNVYLNKYLSYIKWSDQYFNIQSHFEYGRDMPNIEEYILNLDFMKGHRSNTWKDMFGQSFSDFNTCHKLLPDLQLKGEAFAGTAKISWTDPSQETCWNLFKGSDWPNWSDVNNTTINNLPATIRDEILGLTNTGQLIWSAIEMSVRQEIAEFLAKNAQDYSATCKSINDLVTQGFLVTEVPIKLQSLQEKKSLIKNFDESISWYNDWVDQNGFGKKYNSAELEQLMQSEETKLSNSFNALLP